MKFSDRFVKKQLEITKPLADNTRLDTIRSVQDGLGRMMSFANRRTVVIREELFGGVKGILAVPRDAIRSGLILYLHGGGYTCGSIDYAKGYSSVLATECGMRCAAIEYRLAPEHPYPSATEDALSAYLALIEMGYTPDSIILAGESAGGGLCYALCLLLKEKNLPMPAGIIAISPWCDLAMEGASYKEKSGTDPSLTQQRLNFFSKCYVGEFDGEGKIKKSGSSSSSNQKCKDPHVSPIYADLSGMPPSVILAGSLEMLLSDAQTMHERLTMAGSESSLYIREGMWHAYLLYCLESSKPDYRIINSFISHVLPKNSQRKLRWMSLDNSAKIYPASRTSRWTNIFRLSATLTEDVDREVLQSALDVTVRRFPSISVRIRRGMFWYYLEEVEHAPPVQDEKPWPLVRMPFDDIRSCAFRVLIYKKRIAVEFFHALTDGNGGLIFLKTLVAEYLSQKYSITIPAGYGVLDRLEEPTEEELEDSFIRHSGRFHQSRKEPDSYRVQGQPEPDDFCHNTTFILDTDSLLAAARQRGVTVTSFLTAAFIMSGIDLQNLEIPSKRKQKPVRVLVPCDLRRLFDSKTLRNFVLYATPSVDPKLGEYSFDEVASIVAKQLSLEITPKIMASKIRTNVKDEQNMLLKLAPLFLKNIVMKMVFLNVGEKKSMISMSNLGLAKIPEEMKKYVARMDFVLSVQSTAPYNVGVISYGKSTYINVIRNIKQPRLEAAFYKTLKALGIHVKVESNQR